MSLLLFHNLLCSYKRDAPVLPILTQSLWISHAAQKLKFSIKDFFTKYEQICNFLRIWSYLLKNSLMGNIVSCAVTGP